MLSSNLTFIDHILTYHTAWIYIKRSGVSLSIIYYLSALNMLPDLDASFVLNYLQNPTPDDEVALDLLLHDDDTPLLNIDPEQTPEQTRFASPRR